MMEPKSVELQPLIKSFSFCDIDEPADRMRAFRWNMIHRQIEGGAFEGNLIVAQLAGMQFARVAYNREIRSWGNSPPGMIALAVPLSSPQLLTWHGHSISMNQIILQKGSQGVDFLRQGTFHHALVVIDIAALLQAADITHQPQIELLLLDNALIAQPDETALNRFRFYFQTLFALIQMHPERVLRPITQTFIRKKAIMLMLNLLTPKIDVPALRPSSRYQIMKQAETLMLENLERPLTIHDLCMELHVSERTLRYGFQEYFGMNPIAYLRAHRLNSVRRQLKTVAVAQTTVTDIAIQWGFWHMGQFAKDYKKMFGESPSETLRYSDIRAKA